MIYTAKHTIIHSFYVESLYDTAINLAIIITMIYIIHVKCILVKAISEPPSSSSSFSIINSLKLS